MRNEVINVNLQIFSSFSSHPQHLRPGHELQQHRSFASTAEDDDGKKSDKHKNQLNSGGEFPRGVSF